MNFSIEINQAIDWTVRLVSFCVLIDTAEKFCSFREFKNSGLFGWKWIRKHPGFANRRQIIQNFAAFFLNFRTWLLLSGLRGLAALTLLLAPHPNPITAGGLFIMFLAGSLENFRRTPYQPETPNRFTLMIIGALFLQSLYPSQIVTTACLWFIALQSCLSYATAGFVKLFDPDWRSGNGVFRVVNSTYWMSTSKPAYFFGRHQRIGKILNHLTIFMECLFPLVLLIGKPYFLFFLIWGVLFHFTNVVLLRLNNFFWAWIATYPAIIYLAQK